MKAQAKCLDINVKINNIFFLVSAHFFLDKMYGRHSWADFLYTLFLDFIYILTFPYSFLFMQYPKMHILTFPYSFLFMRHTKMHIKMGDNVVSSPIKPLKHIPIGATSGAKYSPLKTYYTQYCILRYQTGTWKQKH